MEIDHSLLVSNDGLLRDLQLLCAVARRSSFVTASQDMGMSPSHVSKRIAVLEETLGVKLFRRTTRRVSTTSEGEAAIQWAHKILDDVACMADAFADVATAPRGALRISTSLRLGREHVAPILSLLKQRHPGLDIWLELLDRRVDLIDEGFDLDVRVGEVQEPHLIAHKIANSARILCAAPAYVARAGMPRVLADLAQHDCLPFRDRDHRFGVWRMTGPQGDESVKVTGSMASNQSDVVRQWALEGYGVIMASVWDAAAALRSGALVRVLPDYQQRADVWAVTSARSSSSARIRVCVDFLKAQLTQGPFALVTDVELGR